ncbi:protein DOG1-like 4 [Phoenix dactylifera]|uniref:Protein DOG1-like 4 n=1 Tax=Phoenix dactylifera TaxID=42345 RepID=A0A8B7C7L5_PHODC|nr:protein DOG1-like 4 [Phoenix dactylifera]
MARDRRRAAAKRQLDTGPPPDIASQPTNGCIPHKPYKRVGSLLPSARNVPCPMESSDGPDAIPDATQNGEPREQFAELFECWLAERKLHLQALRAAASAPRPETPDEEAEEERRLTLLVRRVLGHCEYYYRAKAASAKRDVTPMFSPTWTSSSENLFLWVGGWRPSVAFHLIYSKSGIQLESQLAKVIRGASTRDLADLSQGQLKRIDELQRRTIRIEKEISEEEARTQEGVADKQMVLLSHVLREMGRDGKAAEMMEPAMQDKRAGMERVLERADALRQETLKGVVEILRPMQTIHFLITAAELRLRVREYGMKKDAEKGTASSG